MPKRLKKAEIAAQLSMLEKLASSQVAPTRATLLLDSLVELGQQLYIMECYRRSPALNTARLWLMDVILLTAEQSAKYRGISVEEIKEKLLDTLPVAHMSLRQVADKLSGCFLTYKDILSQHRERVYKIKTNILDELAYESI